MLRVGLTGGIACGKSRVLVRLGAKGLATLDLDALGHHVMAPGGSAHDDVVAAFGSRILAPDGSIDRKSLGAVVFSDPAARRRLDALVHPRVRAEEAERAARLEAAGEAVLVSDAALLVEAGHHAVTVHDQGVGGIADAELASLCREEGRALVTLDLGFGDIRSYPPSEFAGLVVFRLDRQDKSHVLTLCRRLVAALEDEELTGLLWIVEENRVRIRGSNETD